MDVQTRAMAMVVVVAMETVATNVTATLAGKETDVILPWRWCVPMAMMMTKVPKQNA